MVTETKTKVVGDPEVVKALTLSSQAELARRIGVTAPYMSMVLAGRRMPRTPVLMKLARVLGVGVESLYRHLILLKQRKCAIVDQS